MVRRAVIAVVVLALSMASFGTSSTTAPAGAAAPERSVPGSDGPRPRAVFTPGTESALAARVEREPYRSIFLEAHARHEARRATRTPGDPDKEAQKDMARSARWLAFTYAIDRTVINGQVVPFPSEEDRQTTGEIVEELLLGAYGRSRFAVPPPLGGWDRDIDTAGEILQWTGTLDTMLGAGFDFEGADETIAETLIELTAELYRNYTRPETANGVAGLHQNNHRSKSGAAMATAAVVLAEYAPDPADDPDGSRDPLAWWDYGVTQVDDILRHTLVTGDGAYAEGTHYWRFTTESIAPFVGMWARVLGDSSWTTAEGRVVPALHTTPLFARTQDWMVAMTLPDGTLAPIDDANTRGVQHFGALPPLPNSDVYAWRWATANPPFAQEGTVDLAVDSIVAYDDSIIPREPAGSPTSFWYEGGNAVFRSGWGPDDTLVIAQGEGPTASEFGRDAAGVGRAPQSHEHIEPGSYLLHAHGTALVLDPGYLSFSRHDRLLAASDHNMVLVDGAGPEAMLTNSFAWLEDPTGPPPQDGFATIHSTLDTDRVDSATVTTRYGEAGGGTDIQLDRRFLFVDDRYLVIADEITPATDSPVELTWLLHGNGGGTSGGTYTPTVDGGTWSQPSARVSNAITTSAGPLTIDSVLEEHESPLRRGEELTHEAQHARVTATGTVRSIQVVVPSPTNASAPTLRTRTDQGVLSADIEDQATGRTATVRWDDEGLVLVDTNAGGTDPVAFATGSELDVNGIVLSAPGASAVVAAAEGDGWELGAVDPSHSLFVEGLSNGSVHGACTTQTSPDRLRIDPSDAARVQWRPDPANRRPGAVAFARVARSAVGTQVVVDGTRSCDADGDTLTPSWELVSAPRGSNWVLDDTDGWTPRLAVDATGTFRVRLTVTDSQGNASDPVETVIVGGDRCSDERDDDLDGRFDGADPDCDGPEPPPPTDAIGFILPGRYIGAAHGPVDLLRVERDPDGEIVSVSGTIGQDGRVMALWVGRNPISSAATGLILIVDPAANRLNLRLWRGAILEPEPGVLVGIDDPLDTVWIAVDQPT